MACASVFHTAQRVACTGLVGSALLALVLGLLVVPTDALRVLLVPVNGERYFFVPVALLAVVGVIAVTSRPRSPFAMVLVAVCVGGAFVGYRLIDRPARDWRSFVACVDLRSAGSHECATVINPNWFDSSTGFGRQDSRNLNLGRMREGVRHALFCVPRAR